MPDQLNAAEDAVITRVMNVLNHEVEVLEITIKTLGERLALILKPSTPETANNASAPIDGEEVSQLSEAILALASRIRQQHEVLSALDRRLDL